MSEQLIFDNYLLLLKSTVEVYVHGTLESTNLEVRELLKKSLNDTLSMQSTTYDEMTNLGWYTVENVSSKIIDKAYTKVQNGN